jgi:hypothetical protein
VRSDRCARAEAPGLAFVGLTIARADGKRSLGVWGRGRREFQGVSGKPAREFSETERLDADGGNGFGMRPPERFSERSRSSALGPLWPKTHPLNPNPLPARVCGPTRRSHPHSGTIKPPVADCSASGVIGALLG